MWHLSGRGLIACLTGLLGASFLGDLHPLGDSLAVFRPVLLVGLLLVCALVFKWAVARVLALVAAVGLLWHISGFWFHAVPTGAVDLVVYQKNVLFRPTERGPLLADIAEVGADILTLQEVSQANLPMLDRLRASYPHQLVCNGHSVGAVAILSRTPLRQQSCGGQPGFARAVTTIEGRNVQVYSVHLFWPWPFAQAQQVQEMLKDMAPLQDGVTIVGGDFNMVAAGRTVARISDATGARRVGPLVRTFRLFGYPLGIDHVLATGGRGTLETRDLLGADHYGIVARIGFSPP